jgi:hypothetical protein
MGLIIHLCGPCYSGKSYLMSKVLYDFPNLKTILFEKHLHDKIKMVDKYKLFFNDIEESSKTSDVIAESIYSSTNKVCYYKLDNVLNIICLPSFKDHQTNLNKYISAFGQDELYKARTGRINLSYLRQDFLNNGCPTVNKKIYNLHNYEDIKEEIKKCI